MTLNHNDMILEKDLSTKDFGSVNLSVGTNSGSNQKQDLALKQLISNVHGFVHGHIHKHKDHTHIHGHIHSHDAENNNDNQDCPLEELPLCEVLCTELDDCYYTNCEDYLDPSCTDIQLELNNTEPVCLESESMPMSRYEESSKHHSNNLCLKNNDRNIFDQIFNEFNKDITQSNLEKDGISIDDIHYPHEIHPIENTHKTYFHTNILKQNIIEGFGDYDFHFQFDNTKDEKEKQIEVLPEPMSCKWNSCFTSLSTQDLASHVYKDHVKDHSISNEISCEWLNCNNSFNNIDAFMKHLSSHKDERLQNDNLLTPESVETTNESDTINNIHISDVRFKKQKVIDPDFTCCWELGTENGEYVKCNKQFDSAGELQEHLISCHIGSGKSSYNCNWVGCDRHRGKNFPQRQKILRHIHIHTNYKPWKCDICDARFAVESMLIQHNRIHSGEKPFKCSLCGKKFTTSSSLSIHNRTHTGEKPLSCKFPGCNKKFSESSNLAKHMRTHVKFQCGECGLTFDRKTTYLKHMNIHEPLPKQKALDTIAYSV